MFCCKEGDPSHTFGQTAKRVALKWEAITSYTACTCQVSMAESTSPGWLLLRRSLSASPPQPASKHLSQAITMRSPVALLYPFISK